MQILSRLSLKLENYDKCYLVSDNDCSLGALYDYSCALQSFLLQRMREEEDKKAEKAEKPLEA